MWLTPRGEEPGSHLIHRMKALRPGVPPTLLLIGVAIVMLVVWTLIGEFFTRVLGDDWLGRTDRAVSKWFADQRTEGLNSITNVLTYLSETITVTVVGSAIFVAARIAFRRWRESLFLLAAVAGEVLIFLGLTLLVDRNRPAVEHLDVAPPTSSFPSGHTAAAVVLYGAIAVIASDNLRSAATIKVLTVLAFLIPVVVGLARVYRGMHYPTDVIAGAALGIVWLVVTVRCTRLGVGHAELSADRKVSA
jgi:membrane-associated phospholipid phosphatase